MNAEKKGKDLFIVDNSVSGWTGLRYGRGFSTTNLRYFRTFYQVYADRTPEIRQTASGELGPAPASVKIRHTPSGVLDAGSVCRAGVAHA
jgi:hypothetical protein